MMNGAIFSPIYQKSRLGHGSTDGLYKMDLGYLNYEFFVWWGKWILCEKIGLEDSSNICGRENFLLT